MFCSAVGTLLRLFDVACKPVSGILYHGQLDRQILYPAESFLCLVNGLVGRAEGVGRLSGVRHIFHMGDFCSHDTARLDRDRILDGHGVCQKLHCGDPVLNIGARRH